MNSKKVSDKEKFKYFNLSGFTSSLLFAVADLFAEWDGTVLLHSGGDHDSSKSSFLALFPFETITVFAQKIDHQKGSFRQFAFVENPWNGLQEHFFSPLSEDPEAMAFGWFGYGMGFYADPQQTLRGPPSSLPDAYWQRCAVTLTVDRQTREARVQVDHSALELLMEEAKEWVRRLSTEKGWREFIQGLPLHLAVYESFQEPQQPFLNCSERKKSYFQSFMEVQELIRAGEIYQVNLSQQFEFASNRPPFCLFRQASDLNPAPFSAYFRHEACSIVSTSPERFLCKKGGVLETRPIKGTIRRGRTSEEDQCLKERLLASEKERAELLMITDLMRNDLGKISLPGSVQTKGIWRCEAYSNVFHLLSIIQSTPYPSMQPLEIVRSCFPGGSITGCPKLRALEVIDALEKRPRGIYTGAIGYFTGQGDFDLNIAIRTLVAENQTYTLQLGGGIVIDSDVEQEYQETLVKGASIFHALQSKVLRSESKPV